MSLLPLCVQQRYGDYVLQEGFGMALSRVPLLLYNLSSFAKRPESFMCAQMAYALSPVKLLEKDDIIHTWRERMMAAYGGTGKNAIGHPESL